VWPFGRRSSLGRLGEKLAVKHLRRKGQKILARNYRCPAGEADVIALDLSTRAETGCETIAFVEVKTRSDDAYVDPESAVDRRKRNQLVRVAEYYLSHHRAAEYGVRFDVVAVVIGRSGKPRIRHIRDAFESV
jgi:putative endonuclease